MATAERYSLLRLQISPNLPFTARIIQDSCWVPRWGQSGKEGEIFVFSNGSFVCWGLDEKEAQRFKTEVIESVPGVELAPLKEDEMEDLDFVTDPNE